MKVGPVETPEEEADERARGDAPAAEPVDAPVVRRGE
jgi:hypothetical protein